MPILLQEIQFEDCCHPNVLTLRRSVQRWQTTEAAAHPMQGASRQPRSIRTGLSEYATTTGRKLGRLGWYSHPCDVCEGSRPSVEFEFVDCDAALSMSMKYSTGSWWDP